MHVGIDTDPETIPDPRRLHILLDEELRQMERLARARHPAGAGSAAPALPRSATARRRIVRARPRTLVATRRR
jgi:hypothetical protein